MWRQPSGWLGPAPSLARLAGALGAYGLCRHRYGLCFPLAFAGRVARVSPPTGILLGRARMYVVASVLEAAQLVE